MKQLKFLLITVLSCCLVILTVTACNTQTDPATGSPQRLTMGTSADFPPYGYIDTSSGSEQILGFDIDIAQFITQQLGYELEITNMDFNGLIPALQSNRVDFAIAAMVPTPERRKSVDFSEVYYAARSAIVSKQGAKLTTQASLNGKRVGVQLGSVEEETATQIAGVTVIPYNTLGSIIQEVKNGRVDAAIIEETVAKAYGAANADLEFHSLPEQPETGSAIAFPEGSELTAPFNQVLQEMKSSGHIEAFVNKWFGEDSPAYSQAS